MDFQPVVGQTLEARDFVADFVVENFGAAAGDGIESGIAEAGNRVADVQVAVFGNRENFGGRVAVQVNLREALFDAAQHFFVPFDFEVGMQASLHEHASAAEFDGLVNLS